MSTENKDVEPPICPVCGQPVEQLDPVRGRARKIHSWCTNKREVAQRRVRRSRRLAEISRELDESRKEVELAGRRLNLTIKDVNQTILETNREQMQWIRGDIRVAALVMNFRPDLLDQAIGPGIRTSGVDRRTDTGPEVNHPVGPQVDHGPVDHQWTMDQWTTSEPVDRTMNQRSDTMNHHWTMDHEPDHGPMNHRRTDTGPDHEPVSHRWANHEPSDRISGPDRTGEPDKVSNHGPLDWTDTGPTRSNGPEPEPAKRTNEPPAMNHESQSGPDLVAIRIALGFRPVPPSKPLTEHEEQERDVTTVRRVLHELGQDSLNLIADLVDWNGERPWRFDRTITREGSIPNEFHEQIPDPGDRTDFSTWTYDLENTLLHIPVKHVIDRMWTQDATNEHHSPQQLRKYNPNTHG